MNIFQWRLNNAFEQKYQVHSMAVKGAIELDNGGKILLPPSALDYLTRLQISWPVFFNVRNPSGNKQTHCGVQEFTSEEGKCYMPYWMMQQLNLQEGSLVVVRQVAMLPGTFAKIQPHSKDFLDITDPRAVLEKHLRDYSCMTKGDVFQFSYNNKKFAFNVLEVRPGNAVSIVETDINMDFAPPLDYVEPVAPKAAEKEKEKKKGEEGVLEPDVHVVPALVGSQGQGQGMRLGGEKKARTEEVAPPPLKTRLTLGAPATAVANQQTNQQANPPKQNQPQKQQQPDPKADYWASLGSGNSLKSSKK